MKQILRLIDRALCERIFENFSRVTPGSAPCAITFPQLLFLTTLDIVERWWCGLLEVALKIHQADYDDGKHSMKNHVFPLMSLLGRIEGI
jgi:hypothetical protein